jgi:ATP:ADP antiporter, AAA family
VRSSVPEALGFRNVPQGFEIGLYLLSMTEHESPSKTALERALGLFAEVRASEAATALLLMLDVFLLLLAYYLLKVVREPLILMGGGAEVKSYASAGQALLLVIVAAIYGWLARKMNRIRLIAVVTLFFVSNLFVFVVLGRSGVSLGVPFFLWVGVFNLALVAQFWAFAADVYDQEQGKRLFPVLGIGSSVGAVAGSAVAKALLPWGPWALMMICACILVVCLALTALVHKREGAAGAKTGGAENTLDGKNAFALLLQDRYLQWLGALSLVINVVNSNGEYILDRLLLGAAEEAGKHGEAASQFIGAFKAEYFQWVNIVGVVVQLFVVSRVLKYFGVRVALFVMPVVSLAGYSLLCVFPLLKLVFPVKVAENSLDYSLESTARQALWLVPSREAKYKVKQLVDAFLVRAGDVTSAGVVLMGTQLGFATVHFIMVNVVFVAAWGVVVLLLSREHRRRTADEEGRSSLSSAVG